MGRSGDGRPVAFSKNPDQETLSSGGCTEFVWNGKKVLRKTSEISPEVVLTAKK
jgi:hypothetical protein